MSSAAAAVEKTATKSKVGKKFYQTEGFHSFLLLLPYGLLFFTFILLPIIIAIGLSFTYFDVINTPKFAVYKKMKRGKTVEEIADDLEEDIEVINPIFNEIEKVGLDKSL